MSNKFCLIVFFSSVLIYILTCVISKYKKIIPSKYRNTMLDLKQTNIKFRVFFLYVIILLNILFILNLNKTVFFNNYYKIFKVIFASIFFMIGFLLSEGKKIIYVIYDNYPFNLKQMIITLLLIILYKLYFAMKFPIFLAMFIIFIICLVDFYLDFNKSKNNMNGQQFILDVSFLNLIIFDVVFILIDLFMKRGVLNV